jgi:F-type H+-transporting ATPase subunit delta
MSQSTAANRYAKALFQLAQEKNLLKEVTEDLREVKVVFEKIKNYSNYLIRQKSMLTKRKQSFLSYSLPYNQLLSML